MAQIFDPYHLRTVEITSRNAIRFRYKAETTICLISPESDEGNIEPPQNAGVSTEVKPDEVYNLAAQSDLELDDFIAAPLGIYS